MRKLNHKSKAFSLIELSIVILVIGVLIAGVTSGSSLITKARLKTAQTLTESAPVSSTKGLRLWLETTGANSLSSTIEDGDAVTVWNDTNPQNANKFFARNDSSAILYKAEDGINSVPSLYFPSGTAATTFFTLSYNKTGTISPFSIATPYNAFTYFVVASPDALGVIDNIFFNGDASSDGWGYGNTTSNKSMLFDSGSDETGIAAVAYAQVISGTSSGTKFGNEVKLYTNGVIDSTIGSSTTVSVVAPTSGFYIGSEDSTGSDTANFKGYISEIIIFDRKLNNADRHEIEKYLGQKYNITIYE